MKRLRILLSCLVALSSGAAWAVDGKLAEEKHCFGCHATTTDGAGPSFQKISARWRGKADAEAMLVRTIRQGSPGTGGPHWGKATMPDQSERPVVSEIEAKQIATWILGL